MPLNERHKIGCLRLKYAQENINTVSYWNNVNQLEILSAPKIGLQRRLWPARSEEHEKIGANQIGTPPPEMRAVPSCWQTDRKLIPSACTKSRLAPALLFGVFLPGDQKTIPLQIGQWGNAQIKDEFQ